MVKPEKTVVRETLYIAACTAVLSIVMEAAFYFLGYWDITVLLGNLLGAFAAVLNFFLMGLGIQKIVNSGTDKPEGRVRLYMTLRMLMLAGFMVLGGVLKCFNLFAVIIPVFFPTIGIYAQKFLFINRKNSEV